MTGNLDMNNKQIKDMLNQLMIMMLLPKNILMTNWSKVILSAAIKQMNSNILQIPMKAVQNIISQCME